jgi:hypothetical protein
MPRADNAGTQPLDGGLVIIFSLFISFITCRFQTWNTYLRRVSTSTRQCAFIAEPYVAQHSNTSLPSSRLLLTHRIISGIDTVVRDGRSYECDYRKAVCAVATYIQGEEAGFR